MSAPKGGAPTPSTEWWENVDLADVAGCTKAVEDFIINDIGTVDEAQFLRVLPLMVMCGGDDPPLLADRITKKTDAVCETAKAIPTDEEAIPILLKRIRQLNLLGDALARLPDSFKRDPADPAAHRYKEENVAKVYDAAQAGISDCRQAILKRGAGPKLDIKSAQPRNP